MAANFIRSTDTIEVKSIGVVLYGRPGVRKTSVAQTAEKPFTFAFDKGIYRAHGRKDCATFDTWYDVIDACEEADKIRESKSCAGNPLHLAIAYSKTIVIDTIAMAMESLAKSLYTENSKLGNRSGGLSQMGYGVLAKQFSQWISDRHSVGQDIVMIAHEDSEKMGEEDYHFPAVLGKKFYSTLMYHADLVGYMYVDGGKYILDFNPSSGFMAKAPPISCRPIQIPDLYKAPSFLASVISNAKDNMGKISDESRKIIHLVEEWEKFIERDPTIDEINQKLPSMSFLDLNPKKQVWDMVMKFASKCGLVFDKDSKTFSRKP